MPHRIAVIGAGWRAEFYMRLARALPDHFDLVGVLARRREVREAVAERFQVATFTSLDEMVEQTGPDYVVVSVPRKVAPSFIRHLNKAGVPTLTETPPAHHECGLRGLWKSLSRPNLVQVAEQYPMMPTHSARAAVVRRGIIGEPTSVHVSSTHDYHAVALMRAYLGVGFESVAVRTQVTEAPLINPRTREGLTRASSPTLAKTTLATVSFGDEGDIGFTRTGLYDFTDNQWHNQLRHRNIVVRGSLGEIQNDSVVHWDGPGRVLTSPIIRQMSGLDLNLEGFDTQFFQFEGEVLWKNSYEGARLSDEDLAVVTMMEQMGRYVKGEGPAPYPLAEALQDTAISLAIHRSAQSGLEERVEGEPWAVA